MKKAPINIIRWIARIVGSLLVLFVLLMFIGYAINPQDTGKITSTEIPLFMGMIAMLLGIIVAWFREGIGALLIFGGFLLFFVQEIIKNKNFDVWILVIFPVIGLLFLLCWWQSRKLVQRPT
jgi:Na+/melibiose symporter-like transporter